MIDDDRLPEPARRGRTRITARALDRVVGAVAAERLGADRRGLSTEVDDAGGDLSVTVRTRLRVPSLDTVRDDSGVVSRRGGTVVERTTRAQREIRERVSAITGSTVARVVVEVTGAEIATPRRVR